MLYILSLGDPMQLSSQGLSPGVHPGGFTFGVLNSFVGLARTDDDSLEPVLQFQGRTWPLVEETSSFLSVTSFTAVTDFVAGTFDALIAGDAELQELAQLLAEPSDVLMTNPAFESLRVYEVNAASNSLRLTELPAPINTLNGTDADDVINGTSGDDVISGLAGNDVIFGGSGTDEISGGAGNDVLIASTAIGVSGTGDVAVFEGNLSQYTVVGGTDYAVVTAADGTRDKLFDFSFLRFADGQVDLPSGSALDGAGDPNDFVIAERVALLYEAALNRDGNIDLPGLNFYIDVTERDGLSDEFLAQDLMTSQEFTEAFGDANTLSNADFLEQIYLNVLDRPSDAAGRQFYLDLLDAGTISKALALADIAVSPENTVESTSVLRGLYEASAGEWAFL